MFFLDLKLNICPVQQILVVGLILEPQQQVTLIDVVHPSSSSGDTHTSSGYGGTTRR